MVDWVSEEQASELKLSKAVNAETNERCPFCSKMFSTHHALTAHLRWHSEDIDDMIYQVINKSAKPIRVSTIQNLSNVNFSIQNSIQRLVRSGKVYRVSKGYTTHLTTPVSKPTVSRTKTSFFEIPKVVASSISEEQMNKLIIATLKRLQPEVYNAVVEEIVENMIRYAVGMSEIS